MQRPLTADVMAHLLQHLAAQVAAKGGAKHAAAVNAAEVDIHILNDSSSDSEDELDRPAAKRIKK